MDKKVIPKVDSRGETNLLTINEIGRRSYETPIQTMDRLYKIGRRLEAQKLYHEYQIKKRKIMGL